MEAFILAGVIYLIYKQKKKDDEEYYRKDSTNDKDYVK